MIRVIFHESGVLLKPFIRRAVCVVHTRTAGSIANDSAGAIHILCHVIEPAAAVGT